MIEILPEERWPELKDIFEKEFNSALPHKGRSSIIADIGENGEINGFILTEVQLRIGCIHAPGKKAIKMLRWLEKNMLPDSIVTVIASSERFNSLCEKFKMRRLDGVVYRRDF